VENAVVGRFKTLSQHSPGEITGNYEKPQDSLCSSRYSNQVSPGYKSESLGLEPPCSDLRQMADVDASVQHKV
jgi:hypothetical protein